MDKELLRVVIILIGILVMIGMLIWHFVRTLRERRDTDEFGDSRYRYGDQDFDMDADDDEFDKFPLDSVVDGDALLDDYSMKPRAPVSKLEQTETDLNKPAKPRYELPKLIEFSIVARADQGFNGEELLDAFERVGLKYGSVKVFERVDQNRMVDFAVASMIEPGTFPEAGMENFYCPGIVFFMQPRELDAPATVFDDFVETIDTLAEQLDGVVWDNQRQPLTAETIAQFRQMLA